VADQSLTSCVTRIENAIGILGLRLRPTPMDVMPLASSVDLAKMILLDGATLLAHFQQEAIDRG